MKLTCGGEGHRGVEARCRITKEYFNWKNLAACVRVLVNLFSNFSISHEGDRIQSFLSSPFHGIKLNAEL